MFQRLVSCIVKRCHYMLAYKVIRCVLYHILSLGWNGSVCVSGQGYPGSQKSIPWSRHPASENGTQQQCRRLFSVSHHALEEDEVETDSPRSRSPTVSSPLPKHCSSIVGAVQQNPKFTSCRATNASSKVRTKFLAFNIQNDLTNFMQKKNQSG